MNRERTALIFGNIINVFTVTFDQFNEFLLNESINCAINF